MAWALTPVATACEYACALPPDEDEERDSAWALASSRRGVVSCMAVRAHVNWSAASPYVPVAGHDG